MLAPLFAWRAWRRRTRASTILAALVGICALMQSVSILQHPQPIQPGARFDPNALVAFPGIRIVAGSLMGAWTPASMPWHLATALTVLLAAALAFLACRPGPQREPRLFLALAFAAMLAAAAYRCWDSLPLFSMGDNASRFFYTLQLLLLWLLLSTVHDRARTLRTLAPFTAAWIVAVNAPRLQFPPLPDLRWADYAPQLRAGEAVTVPINPDKAWTFPFPARKQR